MIMVVVAILGTYAASRYYTAANSTGAEQAHELARNLRHTQMLAITWGRQLIVTRSGSSYSVSCAVGGTAPCNLPTVNDPVTGSAFSVNLSSSGATLAGPATIRFDSLGRPSTGAAPATTNSVYTLSSGGSSWTITVRLLTGLVEVSP